MKEIKKFFRLLFNLTYLMNKNTGETHDSLNINAQCGMQYANMKNFTYITKKKFLRLDSEGKADGCRHCMKEYDNG